MTVEITIIGDTIIVDGVEKTPDLTVFDEGIEQLDDNSVHIAFDDGIKCFVVADTLLNGELYENSTEFITKFRDAMPDL